MVIPELFDGKHNFTNVLKIISQSQKLAAINVYVYKSDLEKKLFKRFALRFKRKVFFIKKH